MKPLRESIERHEGRIDEVYLDSLGNPTCGIGHSLKVGSKVPHDAVEAFLKADIANAISDFSRIPKPLRGRLNTVRRRVIVEMIFNLGLNGVLNFNRMWAAIGAGDFDEAKIEMLDSVWARQVKGRADELANIMQKGGDWNELVNDCNEGTTDNYRADGYS